MLAVAQRGGVEAGGRLWSVGREELWENEAAMTIRFKIIKLLVKERDEQARRTKEGRGDAEADAAAAVLRDKISKALRQAGEALGKALGGVDRMFDEGATENGSSSPSGIDFYRVLPLRTAIKNLSPEVMEVLLGSRSENDAYYLLCAWLSQSPHFPGKKERWALFKQLLPSPRFHHMSWDFLGAVVSACPYANAPDLMQRIMRRSHAPCTVPWSQAGIKSHYVKLGKSDRSVGHLRSIFKSTFHLVDPLPLLQGPNEPDQAYKFVGLAVGFPVAVSVEHKAEGTVGLFVDARMPIDKKVDVEEEDNFYAGFAYSITSGRKTSEPVREFFNGEGGWGWSDYFDKPWVDVVCPESPYFPKGVLEVEVTMTPI